MNLAATRDPRCPHSHALSDPLTREALPTMNTLTPALPATPYMEISHAKARPAVEYFRPHTQVRAVRHRVRVPCGLGLLRRRGNRAGGRRTSCAAHAYSQSCTLRGSNGRNRDIQQ